MTRLHALVPRTCSVRSRESVEEPTYRISSDVSRSDAGGETMKRNRVITTALVFVLGAGVIAFAPLPDATVKPANRRFRIEASSFKYTPATIRVNAGDHVTIDLVATDVVHGLYVDGYDVRVTADPGRTASLSFVANRAGMFRLRCSVTCGAMHPFMIGKLRVGRNDLLWRALALALLSGLAGVLLTTMRRART